MHATRHNNNKRAHGPATARRHHTPLVPQPGSVQVTVTFDRVSRLPAEANHCSRNPASYAAAGRQGCEGADRRTFHGTRIVMYNALRHTRFLLLAPAVLWFRNALQSVPAGKISFCLCITPAKPSLLVKAPLLFPTWRSGGEELAAGPAIVSKRKKRLDGPGPGCPAQTPTTI